MRIGLFHAVLPRPGEKPGGVAVFVDRLARRLQGRGHDVTVLSCGPAPPGAPYRRVAVGPESLTTNRAWRLMGVPVMLHRANRLPLDVLHLHGDDWFFLRRRLPTVRTFHGSALSERIHSTSARGRAQFAVVYPLERLAARQATGVYGVGPDSEMLYRAHGLLPLGVDVPEPAPDGPREVAPTILFVGTWGGRKRGAWLARTFVDEVLPRVPGARLWMVSDRCDPHPSITWIPAPSDEDLAALYRRAWLFCLPSRYEGLGIPYLEAMAQGTPVLATRNPGSEMVLASGLSGRLVEDADLGAAAVALLTDDGARAQLRRAGLERVAAFSWSSVLDRHENAYRAAIASWNERRDPR